MSRLLYVTCGLEDSPYEMNIEFRDLANANSIPPTYEEDLGGYAWDFWDIYIRRAFDWLDQNLIQGK